MITLTKLVAIAIYPQSRDGGLRKLPVGGDRDEFVKAGSKKVLFDSAEGLLEKLHRLGDKLQVISLGPCAKNPRTDRSGGSLGF